MTPRQFQVLQFIREHISRRGEAPTRMEITHAIGTRWPNSSECIVRSLVKLGALKIGPRGSRNIELAAP